MTREADDGDDWKPAPGWKRNLFGLLAAAGIAALVASLIFATRLGVWYFRDRWANRQNALPVPPRTEARPSDDEPFHPHPPPFPRTPIAVPWTARPDPTPNAVTPITAVGAPVPLPDGAEVLFSSTDHRYGLIHSFENRRGSVQGFDLAAARPLGPVRMIDRLSEPLALSPDGAAVAGKVPSQMAVAVCPLADGTPARRIDLDIGTRSLDFLDFTVRGRVVAVVATSQGKAVQVWEIAGREIVHEIALADSEAVIALSPGRKYLTAAPPALGRVNIFDLDAGQLVGRAETPPLMTAAWTCQALSFAPDGKELAALCAGDGRSRIIVWDLRTGTVRSDLRLTADLRHFVPDGQKGQKPSLEWLPGRGGWLVHGRLLIDREHGLLLWQTPASIRLRMLDSAHVLALDVGGRPRTLQVQPLPRAEMEAERKKLIAGWQRKSDRAPAQPADWKEARRLPTATGAARRNAAAEAELPPRRPFATAPIPLASRGDEISSILFSNPAVGEVAVLSAAALNPLAPLRSVMLDRYDLNTGQALGRSELFVTSADRPPELVADFSPDGTRVLVRDPEDQRRIDVWSADGRHQVAWLPFAREASPSDRVTWAAMVGQRRVLTTNAAGTIVLWALPECRAVYAIEGYRGSCTLSPRRECLAAFNGSTIDIRDSLTGECRARLTVPEAADACSALSFRPDGAALVAVLQSAGKQRLYQWDLHDGTCRPSFPVPEASPHLHWCGSGFVLHGSTLLDLKHKLPLWRYQLPGAGAHAHQAPNDRHWYAAGRADAPAALFAQALPNQAAAAVVQLLARPGDPVALRPGMDVGVQVHLPKQCVDERASLEQHLKYRLRDQNFNVANGGRRVLRLDIDEEGAGQRLKCRLALTDGHGAEVWSQDRVFSPTSLRGIGRTQDPATFVKTYLWTSIARWIDHAPLPICAARQGKGILLLPGTSVLPGKR